MQQLKFKITEIVNGNLNNRRRQLSYNSIQGESANIFNGSNLAVNSGRLFIGNTSNGGFCKC